MSLLANIKTSVKRTAPGLFLAVKRQRNARNFRLAHGGAEYRAKRALVAKFGLKVIDGPFKGMAYGNDVNCGAYIAKLVGSYERELHLVIEEILRHPYRTVVDVGCAEGYYAVGIARRMPEAVVHAFDIDEDSRRYCQDLGKRNGVEKRVVVGGFCGPSELSRLCGQESLLICDCEGYEAELLDPVISHGLLRTDILVELHEALSPGVTQSLKNRFETSHNIKLIDTTERNPSDYPQLACVAEADRPWAVREGRPWPMQWAWMKVKSGATEPSPAK